MTPRSILVAGAALSAALSLTSATFAQGAHAPPGSAPPGAAPAPPPNGPPIPGFCVFSRNSILAASKVGQSVAARLTVLDQQVRAELQPEAEAINTEGRTLDSQASTMDAATRQAREANLQLRATNFEKREQLRGQELQATKQKQVEVIMKQLVPILTSLYQQKGCSVLVEGEAAGVVFINPAMDLSPAAVAQLDVRLQTLTFDREHLDTQAGAAAPPN
jgi:Skp family chaperone for outer membrane proteins